VSTSCKEVNKSYRIRLTSKRRTVGTYGFVTASRTISDTIPECHLKKIGCLLVIAGVEWSRFGMWKCGLGFQGIDLSCLSRLVFL
ncbi:hypothetical protein LINGRAHAP2_LOCUS14723, partial [Linum grandiflorum]